MLLLLLFCRGPLRSRALGRTAPPACRLLLSRVLLLLLLRVLRVVLVRVGRVVRPMGGALRRAPRRGASGRPAPRRALGRATSLHIGPVCRRVGWRPRPLPSARGRLRTAGAASGGGRGRAHGAVGRSPCLVSILVRKGDAPRPLPRGVLLLRPLPWAHVCVASAAGAFAAAKPWSTCSRCTGIGPRGLLAGILKHRGPSLRVSLPRQPRQPQPRPAIGVQLLLPNDLGSLGDGVVGQPQLTGGPHGWASASRGS